MIRLIKNATVFAPVCIGVKHILIANNKIAGIYDAEPKITEYTDVYDANGQLLVPGFVDGLVHYCGGGGEGGFGNRTPELNADEAAAAGVTTLVGALGTDAITRTVSNLLGKCRELKEKGLSAFFYSGSYHLPLQTLTQSVETDLMFVPEIIGVGEVALSDHRGSVVRFDDLLAIARQAKTAALLAGKKGVVFCHLGDSPEQLSLLREVVHKADISIRQFIPTHINRNPHLFEDGIQYGLEGGYIDFTTSTNEALLADGEVACAEALKRALEAGVDPSLVSFSSDANASLPLFDEHGQIIGVDTGKISSLFDAVKEAVSEQQVPFSTALACITQNPADALGLPSKGRIEIGTDADLVLLNPDNYNIEKVWSLGKIVHSSTSQEDI